MIDVRITPKRPRLKIDFPGSTKPDIEVDIKAPHSGTEYPFYDGPTTVRPEAHELQILQTEKKAVMENIMVLPIPYFETSNPYGGNTVYIGE